MPLFRLIKTTGVSAFLIFILLLVTFLPTTSWATDAVSPKRTITVIESESSYPSWKITWDDARKFAQNQRYIEAAEIYQVLLRDKPRIEEASWEYCKVLFKLKDYSAVSVLLDSLLENSPSKRDYLLMAARVAYDDGKFSEAITSFGKVLETQPTGRLAESALEGLAYSLREKGMVEQAVILFEKLLLSHPDDIELMQIIAHDWLQLGQKSRAREVYTTLLLSQPVEDKVLFEATEAFDEKGYEKELTNLLVKCLVRKPFNVQMRERLVEIYLTRAEYNKGVQQLDYLLLRDPFNSTYLLKTGEAYLSKLNRPDKALFYFARYSTLNLGDAETLVRIEAIQANLATDLLVIVENDGAELLWEDLVTLEPNRTEIFLEMADILEKDRKYPKLLELLEIVFKNSQTGHDLALRIAKLANTVGEYRKSLNYLVNVYPKDKPHAMFKVYLYGRLGEQLNRLAALQSALVFDESDDELRMDCIQLSGELGFVSQQVELFKYWTGGAGDNVPAPYVVRAITLLSSSQVLSEITPVMVWAKDQYKNDKKSLIEIGIGYAETLQRAGKLRASEQYLRGLLHHEIYIDRILFELGELAVSNRKYDDAEDWIELLENADRDGILYYPDKLFQCRLHLLKGQLHRLNGAYGRAAVELQFGLLGLSSKDIKGEAGLQIRLDLVKEFFWVHLYNGNYIEAGKLLSSFAIGTRFDAEIFVYQYIIAEKMHNPDAMAKLEQQLFREDNPLYSRLLAVAAVELQKHEYSAAEKHLDAVGGILDESVLAKTLYTQLQNVKGSIAESEAGLAKLHKLYPTEYTICQSLIDLYTDQQKYSHAVEVMASCLNVENDFEKLKSTLLTTEKYAFALRLARLTWGMSEHKKALTIYEDLLSPTMVKTLTSRFLEENIEFRYLIRDKSFWNSMLLLLQSDPEVVDTIMEPKFLVENIGKSAGKIVSENFEKYSWYALIENEYLAKNAIWEKNYRYAEQSYLKLLEEERTTQSMVDLASIYSRMGEFRKEARLYEDIKATGSTTPAIDESFKRTVVQLSPQNTLDGYYQKEEGRQGFIDILRKGFGTSFWFTQGLNKDFSFIYAHNQYEAIDDDSSLASNSLLMDTSFDLNSNFELSTKLGGEKLSDGAGSYFIYAVRLDANLGDNMSGFVLVDQRPVYDNIETIQETIYKTSFLTGLDFGTSFGLQFGGDFGHTLFSDDNGQNRFHGFSSYTLYGETLELAFTYDFNHFTSEVSSTRIQAEDNMFSESEISYWSPDTYKEHRGGLYFQHNFLGFEEDGDRRMSFYSVDAALGYEDDQTLVYMTGFDIFLEMTPHFLLKGNFNYKSSDVYREAGMSFSLHYRW
jgi:hypothetical protein